jgi:hypothetical protein
MRTTCCDWLRVKELGDDSVDNPRIPLLFTTTPANDDEFEAVLLSNGIWAKFCGDEISAIEV